MKSGVPSHTGRSVMMGVLFAALAYKLDIQNCLEWGMRRNTSSEQDHCQDKPTGSSVSHISNRNTTETPRPIQENGGYINTGFIMEPTAPPYTDFNSAPPSYDDVGKWRFL
ncbi:Hypothetical predicted protein [Mytilus galloprovincialis]|uniref:Uncharacterized protein n=1 Tax=Mytilus galloprovincialis TaxID=29158 RepID=A0A8B6GJ50_MYTGA|nr:Hypothetical predicted protein [Mytilus galloprovincialis]